MSEWIGELLAGAPGWVIAIAIIVIIIAGLIYWIPLDGYYRRSETQWAKREKEQARLKKEKVSGKK